MVSADDNSAWAFDIESLLKDFPSADDVLPSVDAQSFLSGELNDISGSEGSKEGGSRKRVRADSSIAPSTRACREKMRRDKLNDKFIELSSLLDPGRAPKVDKSGVLTDAVRTLAQLRNQAETLKETCKSLQQKIIDLKAEKFELRDEKLRLKADKASIEHQMRAMSSPGFVAPPGLQFPYSPPCQVVGNKVVPLMGYPGLSMWQFMPPAAVDTSQDHVLRPPVA